jgi:hypothetical protein
MTTVTDRRNRIAVFLYKSDRPAGKFYCHNCRNFVADLVQAEVQSTSDIVHGGPALAIRCSGSIEPGVKCHTWYYFNLGER